MGVSVPMDPSASMPLRAMGVSRIRSSSSVYPKVCWRRATDFEVCTTCSRSGSSSRCTMPARSQSA